MTQISYPILVATGVLLLVNICIFPEFSSGFMASMTIETLDQVSHALRDGGVYFVSDNREHGQPLQSDHIGDQRQHDEHGNLTKTDGSPSRKDRSPAVGKEDVSSQEAVAAQQRASEHISSAPWGHLGDGVAPETKIPEQGEDITLQQLTAAKAGIRAKLKTCKTAQGECNFELAFSVLSPQELKPISTQAIGKLVANTVAVISACESRYALLGEDAGLGLSTPKVQSRRGSAAWKTQEQDDHDDADNDQDTSGPGTPRSQNEGSEKPHSHGRKPGRPGKAAKWHEIDKEDLEMIKPKREIECGDVKLLRYLMQRIARPYQKLQSALDRSLEALSICIAYAYVRFPPYSDQHTLSLIR